MRQWGGGAMLRRDTTTTTRSPGIGPQWPNGQEHEIKAGSAACGGVFCVDEKAEEVATSHVRHRSTAVLGGDAVSIAWRAARKRQEKGHAGPRQQHQRIEHDKTMQRHVHKRHHRRPGRLRETSVGSASPVTQHRKCPKATAQDRRL